MYDILEQAQLRLKGSVVMYDGRPAKVLDAFEEVKGEIGVNISPLPKLRDNIKVSLKDPKLNIREFRLGYVNAYNYAGYLTRMPGRQQKQGLSNGNVCFDDEFQRMVGIGFENIIKRPEFADALMGIYPAFDKCVESLLNNAEMRSIAFCRRFALYQDPELGYFELRYRGARIAWGDPNAFNLPSEHSYLTEVIREQGINIR